MYFGVDYYPEQWVFPFGGTAENPEAQWERDAELMAAAGFNIVRIGEFSWGLVHSQSCDLVRKAKIGIDLEDRF